MTGWVKVDTKFPSHPKVLDIGPVGEALWLRGLCYAGDQLTDGFVPTTFLKRMGDMKAATVAQRLVAAGLWDEVDGGYQIHEFLSWQRSRDEVADISNKRAESGRKGGKQRASNLLAKAEQNPKQSASNLSSKTQAALKDTDTDTDTELIPPTPSSEGESPPTEIGAKRKAKLIDCPDDFQPTPDMQEWAMAKYEIGREELNRRNEHFWLYVGKTGKQYARWDLAWKDAMGWTRHGDNGSPPMAHNDPRRLRAEGRLVV